MKLRFTLSLFTLCFLAFVMMSTSGGRGAVAGEGNTGAPGDDPKLCASCHAGGSFGAEITITIKDSDGLEITEYTPGVSYNLEAIVTTTTAAPGYGLQLVSLIDADGSDTKGINTASSNAQLTTLANGRTYLEQAGLSSTEVFASNWTAPEAGSGSVTFYAAGHAANGTGSTAGDNATNSSFQIQEAESSSVDYLAINGLSISPNPAYDFARISWDDEMDVTVTILDITGRKMNSVQLNGNNTTIDISDYSTGMYFARVVNNRENTSETLRLLKR